MLDLETASLRKLQESDLKQVLDWRNHDDIRKWMMNPEKIEYQDHINWFNKNKDRADRLFFIFEYQNEPQGYVSFQSLENSSAYEWGFYIKPDAEKGIGALLGLTTLDFAFNHLNISKVFGQVLEFNDKSLKFHQKLGFIQEGILRKQFKDDRGEFDIYQYGLFKTEWLENRV
nr:UDP-4-amino-4,6-dideoxy-N-acetyl-beta-L-altrosamine N-acetyltransferase [Acinetobacter sp. Marseille-Q1620]